MRYRAHRLAAAPDVRPKRYPVILAGLLVLMSCTESRQIQTGIRHGKLLPCPDTPNCVCSQSSDKKHFTEPLRYACPLEEARAALVGALGTVDRTRIVVSQSNYIHAECMSRVFRFVDDVEFLFDDNLKTVHCRSASRSGYYDLGVNRKRMERIRKAFQDRLK